MSWDRDKVQIWSWGNLESSTMVDLFYQDTTKYPSLNLILSLLNVPEDRGCSAYCTFRLWVGFYSPVKSKHLEKTIIWSSLQIKLIDCQKVTLGAGGTHKVSKCMGVKCVDGRWSVKTVRFSPGFSICVTLKTIIFNKTLRCNRQELCSAPTTTNTTLI